MMIIIMIMIIITVTLTVTITVTVMITVTVTIMVRIMIERIILYSRYSRYEENTHYYESEIQSILSPILETPKKNFESYI